jgi:hypothetical protein
MFLRQLRVCILWRPLRRKDRSVIYCCCLASPAQSLSEDYILLFQFFRLSQPGGPDLRIYIIQRQGGPVITLGTGLPLRRLILLAGLRCRYFNVPPTWKARSLCVCARARACAYIYIYIYIPQEQIQDRKYKTATYRQEVISGRKTHTGARYHDMLTDCQS